MHNGQYNNSRPLIPINGETVAIASFIKNGCLSSVNQREADF